MPHAGKTAAWYCEGCTKEQKPNTQACPKCCGFSATTDELEASLLELVDGGLMTVRLSPEGERLFSLTAAGREAVERMGADQ